MSEPTHPPLGMLSGKVAVITGAGQGIGRACVDVFLREGARVIAVDFSGAETRVAEQLGERVIPFHADVSQEVEIKDTVDWRAAGTPVPRRVKSSECAGC